jgi:hypothetical protein
MELLLTIAALCNTSNTYHARVDACQAWYLSCYEEKMTLAKVLMYKEKPDTSDVMVLAKCIKQRADETRQK